MAFDWGGFASENGDDLINAALAIWMQNNQDREPRQTNVQLTPEQRWQFDQGKKLFEYSPMRDYVGRVSHSFLENFNPNPSTFRFNSPHMQNQTFAGGVSMPRFDTSGPQYWRNDQPGGVQANGGRGSAIPPGTRTPSPTIMGPSSKPGDSGEQRPGFNRSLPESDGPNIANAPRMPNAWGAKNAITPGNYPGMTAGGAMDNPGARPGDASRPGMSYADPAALASKWNDFKAAHPQIVAAGGVALATAFAAFAGIPGAIAGAVIRWATRANPAGPTPAAPGNPNGTFGPGQSPSNPPRP
jgi:hypothetical protein